MYEFLGYNVSLRFPQSNSKESLFLTKFIIWNILLIFFVDFGVRGELKFFVGLAIGIGIGAATNNLGIGISIGIAFGAAFSQTKNEQKSTDSDSSEEE